MVVVVMVEVEGDADADKGLEGAASALIVCGGGVCGEDEEPVVPPNPNPCDWQHCLGK